MEETEYEKIFEIKELIHINTIDWYCKTILIFGLIIAKFFSHQKINYMITLLNDAPENVAAFNASGEINQKDFKNIVIPHVKNKLAKFNELNYLLYLNENVAQTDIAWLTSLLSNLENTKQCNRAAIVSDDAGIQKISSLKTAENFKIFPKNNVYNAMYWCNNGNEPEYSEK